MRAGWLLVTNDLGFFPLIYPDVEEPNFYVTLLWRPNADPVFVGAAEGIKSSKLAYFCFYKLGDMIIVVITPFPKPTLLMGPDDLFWKIPSC